MNRREWLAGASAALAMARMSYGGAAWALDAASTTSGPPAVPAGLTAAERAIVSAAAEAIIPATDTPGAVEAGVPEFLDLLYREWFGDEERRSFSAGLAALDAASVAQSGRGLAACTAAARNDLLVRLDREAITARDAQRPAPFFGRFKELTLLAHYTSEIGEDVELKAVMDAGEDMPQGPIMFLPPVKL